MDKFSGLLGQTFEQPKFSTGLWGVPEFKRNSFYTPQFVQDKPLGLLGNIG